MSYKDYYRKGKEKSNLINEPWVSFKNNDRVCHIKTKKHVAI